MPSEMYIAGSDFMGDQNKQDQQQQNQQKMMPQNIEAEKSVLAACLLNPHAVEEVAAILKPENFYSAANRTIFNSIMDLYTRNIGVDYLRVVDNLESNKKLDEVGGKAYIAELASNDMALANWKSHSEIVRRTSVLRDLVYAAVSIKALAYDAPDDLSEVVGEAEQKLFNVTEKKLSNDFVKVDKLLESSFNELQELSNNSGKLAGVPTGFKDLDNLFNGLRGGDLVILAARPGVGKTAFALNMAVNAAKRGTKIGFMSLEMGSNQLIQRVLSTEAEINLSKMRSGHIGAADWQKIAEASNVLGSLDFYIDDTPGLSIFDLRAKARRELRDVKNGMIIVDYLQLMQPPSQRGDGNRAVEVAEISRGLKILAKEMNIPVVALSQLSRNVEMRGARGKKGKPQLSDLRESGSIEQDADIVMFIDRSMNEEEAEDETRPEWGTAIVDVAKHRNGATKPVTLSFRPEFTKFGDYFDADAINGGFTEY